MKSAFIMKTNALSVVMLLSLMILSVFIMVIPGKEKSLDNALLLTRDLTNPLQDTLPTDSLVKMMKRKQRSTKTGSAITGIRYLLIMSGLYSAVGFGCSIIKRAKL